jgi:hypothetical protein
MKNLIIAIILIGTFAMLGWGANSAISNFVCHENERTTTINAIIAEIEK